MRLQLRGSTKTSASCGLPPEDASLNQQDSNVDEALWTSTVRTRASAVAKPCVVACLYCSVAAELEEKPLTQQDPNVNGVPSMQNSTLGRDKAKSMDAFIVSFALRSQRSNGQEPTTCLALPSQKASTFTSSPSSSPPLVH